MTTVIVDNDRFEMQMRVDDDAGALHFDAGSVVLQRVCKDVFEVADYYVAKDILRSMRPKRRLLAPIFIRCVLKRACVKHQREDYSTTSWSESIGSPPQALSPLPVRRDIN